jgi:hypothetical protein
MEGKFSTEGLQAVGEDDDLLMAMARELVTEKGIGENAELVWRSIQQENAAFAHGAPVTIEPERETAPEDIFLPREPLPAIVDQLLLFGAPLDAAGARKRIARRSVPAIMPADKQLGLF